MSDHYPEVYTEYGGSHKTLAGYVWGLALSLILTLGSFGLVGWHLLKVSDLYVVISILAVLQLFVQSIFFLRLNASQEGRWNLLPFLFVILIVGILVAGSLWIMYNLNYNMMH